MKRRLVGKSTSLDLKTLVLATVEVISSFEMSEIIKFKKFEDFFGKVDTQNFYEEDWDAEYYRPYYKCIYTSLRGKA